MRWEERLLGLFDDLEQQAEGLALADRDALVAEQSRAAYAEVDLAGRLHASLGRLLRVEVTGVGAVEAELLRGGDGWCLLGSGAQEWLVALPAVLAVRGLADRALEAGARPVTARLGLTSALRGVAQDAGEVVVHRVDGGLTRGHVGRVGRDFVEMRKEAGAVEVVPLAALAVVRAG
jgi:hypothetical protein